MTCATPSQRWHCKTEWTSRPTMIPLSWTMVSAAPTPHRMERTVPFPHPTDLISITFWRGSFGCLSFSLPTQVKNFLAMDSYMWYYPSRQ